MTAYVLRRLLLGVPTVLGVLTLTFGLFHVFGGDPVYEFLGKHASAAEIEALARAHGLDRPLGVRYLHFLLSMVTLDFGRSFVTQREVTAMLLDGLGPSLSLTLPALALTTLLAVVLAVLAAAFRGRALDRTLVLLAVAGMSLSFLVYIVVGQYLFAFRLPWFHVHGYRPGVVERWAYLALPIAVMTSVGVGQELRYYRAVLVEESGREFVTSARARGLSPARVFFVHVLRAALVPIVTRVMISVPFLITGSLLLESFFGIPGLGTAMLDALSRADLPVIQAFTAVVAVLFVLSTTLTDVLYALLDPRVTLR